MRKIEQTTRFRRDYKQLRKRAGGAASAALLRDVIERLAGDHPLPERQRDHPLTGDWTDHRDCHVRPDLVLIYRKPDDKTLQLVRLGSHNELGL